METRALSLIPQPYIVTESRYKSRILSDLHSIWDLRKFSVPRIPLSVGKLSDTAAFMQAVTRVLDMPIKLAGSNSYKIPSYIAPFLSAIQMIVNHEHSVLSEEKLLSYYAYLTIDQSELKEGEAQRKPGAHVDGFQGARVYPKTIINHSYIVSNGTPTVFYPQAFYFSHLDEKIHNFFLEMDKQAIESTAYRTKPYTIYLMDAYTIHRADTATSDCFRTFLRLSYDVKEFDRLGNTINPLLDYQWEMVPREAQATLISHQVITKEESHILGSDDIILFADYLVKLKKLNLEHYYNFTYVGLQSENINKVKLMLISLLNTDKPNIQELRLMFIAAVNQFNPVAYLGKQALISHLLRAKQTIKNNLLSDFILEMITQKPGFLSKEFLAQFAQKEKTNPSSFWVSKKECNDQAVSLFKAKL